ncbi:MULTISPECIES: TrkH family potassium uptake protein [Cyanophyceae]|uniref:TrkH family potassium uptake protein n=1 Tax=Cyanophyceae TaxID=3028117 RepID=UPI0004AAC4E3|nr:MULTISPECIES: TrkH family potassium uptake protein [Cyanophyceae]AMA09858.1 ATPase [Picosynechococcus sp. PCC 73109]
MTIARTICLGFLGAILLGTLLLMLPFSTASGEWNSPLVALFTSTSAVCVTGLIVVDTGTAFSNFGQGVILLLIQLGGLGYMTLSTFLMLLLGRRFDLAQKFAIKESFDQPYNQGTRNLIRSIIATTLIGELTGIFLLFGRFSRDFDPGEGLWLAIFHSISAWNNAGFSLFADSLVGYQNSLLVNGAISGLIIFGGIGYEAIIEMYLWLRHRLQRKSRRFTFSLNFEVVTSTTFWLLGLGTVAFLFVEWANPTTFAGMSWGDKAIAAWFQSVTTRTAGFNSIDIGKLSTAGLFITMGLMFIGASPSGTGGGIKTTTINILANCTKSVLYGQTRVTVFDREIAQSIVFKAIAVVFGSATVITIATAIISISNPEIELIAILFEVISAFATVGLSTGITASLSAVGQLTLIATMYCGRVGVLLLMSAIVGEITPRRISYPEENLLVG